MERRVAGSRWRGGGTLLTLPPSLTLLPLRSSNAPPTAPPPPGRHLEADGGTGATGYTPLHYAARAGSEACVCLLLDARARCALLDCYTIPYYTTTIQIDCSTRLLYYTILYRSRHSLRRAGEVRAAARGVGGRLGVGVRLRGRGRLGSGGRLGGMGRLGGSGGLGSPGRSLRAPPALLPHTGSTRRCDCPLSHVPLSHVPLSHVSLSHGHSRRCNRALPHTWSTRRLLPVSAPEPL